MFPASRGSLGFRHAFLAGYFGDRMYDMATRYSSDVRRVDAEWGTAFTLDEIKGHLAIHKPNVSAGVERGGLRRNGFRLYALEHTAEAGVSCRIALLR